MTYDVLGFHGKIEDPNVHTILFKPSNMAIAQMLKKGSIERHFTVIIRLKCTPQPEHLAEAIYLHHGAHIKYVNPITYVGEAAPKPGREKTEDHSEEYKLVAVKYRMGQSFDASFTINYPKQLDAPNTPFIIMAGDKDTLLNLGMNGAEVHAIPEFAAAKPTYRPESNKTKENIKSQCVFLSPNRTSGGSYLECLENTGVFAVAGQR